MEEFLQLLANGAIKLIVFLVILWVGKKVSAYLSKELSGIAFFERAKVEGFADIPKIIYYILLVATWYVALDYIGIDLSPFMEFVLTNILIVFGVAVGAFGLAWALSKDSQMQANKVVTVFCEKLKELFIGVK